MVEEWLETIVWIRMFQMMNAYDLKNPKWCGA